MMKDIIEYDFDVHLISEIKSEYLFAGIDNLHIRFVWLNEVRSGNNLEQLFVLRYELAKIVQDFLEFNTQEGQHQLTSGELLTVRRINDDIHIYLRTHFSPTDFLVSDLESSFYKMILQDVSTLDSLKAEISDLQKEKTISNVVKKKPYNKDIINNLTNKDYEAMNFEIATMKTIKKRKNLYGLNEIYKIMLCDDLNDTFSLEWLLTDNFQYIYQTQSCDCEDEGCFFDFLKSNLTYFFKDDYTTNDDALDFNKVKSDFKNLWCSLSNKDKSVLLFLTSNFNNSTLLNLAFIKPNFDLTHYEFLMCFPYQPDSDDERYIRMVSTTANYFRASLNHEILH